MNENNNPVHQHEGEWWFYDETWSNRIGPYINEEEAQQACVKHAEMLNQERPFHFFCPNCEKANLFLDDYVFLKDGRVIFDFGCGDLRCRSGIQMECKIVAVNKFKYKDKQYREQVMGEDADEWWNKRKEE